MFVLITTTLRAALAMKNNHRDTILGITRLPLTGPNEAAARALRITSIYSVKAEKRIVFRQRNEIELKKTPPPALEGALSRND